MLVGTVVHGGCHLDVQAALSVGETELTIEGTYRSRGACERLSIQALWFEVDPELADLPIVVNLNAI